MNLQKLISDFAPAEKYPEMDIVGLCHDSRNVSAGDLYFAVKGGSVDGNDFIPEVIATGAVAIVSEKPSPTSHPKNIPWLQVDDVRIVMSRVASIFHDHPSEKLKVVGVTGTNGKTTTAWIVKQLLDLGQTPCGLIGTLGYYFTDEKTKPSAYTTPQSVRLQSLLDEMCDDGCAAVAMEVSSHGLAQHRVDDVEFDVGIFTNLSQDHLDYHSTIEQYFSEKIKLFENIARQTNKTKPTCIINNDDEHGRKIIKYLKNKQHVVVQKIGTSSGCDWRYTDVTTISTGTQFTLEHKGREFFVRSPLLGKYNVENCVAAIAAVVALGANKRETVTNLQKIEQIPGRMQSIKSATGLKIYIDYAHTPDALEQAAKTLRPLANRGLTILFGCGGDRDKGKRPLMAAVAEKYADKIILTSDNPRFEDPDDIINDIIKGFRTKKYTVYPSRREAISQLIKASFPGEVLLIAGKGHESTQLIKGRSIEFSDRAEIENALSDKVTAR